METEENTFIQFPTAEAAERYANVLSHYEVDFCLYGEEEPPTMILVEPGYEIPDPSEASGKIVGEP